MACPKRFSDRSSLRSHMRQHTGEKPYKCDVCQHEFRQVSNLNVHKLRHVEANETAKQVVEHVNGDIRECQQIDKFDGDLGERQWTDRCDGDLSEHHFIVKTEPIEQDFSVTAGED